MSRSTRDCLAKLWIGLSSIITGCMNSAWCVCAGIAVPDATYGIACQPAAGSALDPHHTQPWTEATRAAVTWWKDAPTSHATQCFNYNPASDETVASVADRFGMDMVTFAHDEHNVDVFGVGNVSIKFPNLRAEEMASVLQIVGTATKAVTRGTAAYQPYFKCVYYDETGKGSQVVCKGTTPQLNADCTRPGTASCT